MDQGKFSPFQKSIHKHVKSQIIFLVAIRLTVQVQTLRRHPRRRDARERRSRKRKNQRKNDDDEGLVHNLEA